MPKPVYLKPNVVMEPLYESWYAWTHLISPATTALNVLERHLNILESYIAAPDVHADAVKNPKLLGGPFVDLGGERVEEIEELMQATLASHARQLEFARAVKDLDRMLAAEGKGFGMESLYAKIPAILKGYVELYYDRNNNASFRFFEALLYSSEFYKKNAQSIALWITDNDHRPFVLSTPRLNEQHVLRLNISFDDPVIDTLSRMKREARDYSEIRSMLNIPSDKEQLFESFFSEEAPPPYQKYTGGRIRMRYFGHACILVETKDVSILVDPLISYYGYRSDVEHFSDVDLPDEIDFVLITHNHQDHILLETLLLLRNRIKNIVIPSSNSGKLEDPDLKLVLVNLGFKNVVTVDEMERLKFADATITGIPFTGEHCDLNILSKMCYLIEISNFKLMFLADSRIVEPQLYDHIQKQIGNVDIVFLGMECDGAPLSWLYGPLMTTKKITREQDASRRFSGSDCERGMSIVNIFKPREIYVYAMGLEPWVEFISTIRYDDEANPIIQSDKLVKICRERGIVAERLFGEKELLYERKHEHGLVASVFSPSLRLERSGF